MKELRAGRVVGGRYLLLERLGLGGMGEVWLAEQQGDAGFARRVVVKTLAPGRRGDARLAQMLAEEARVVALLHHPCLVAALDFVEAREGPLFVQQYVDGISLRVALRRARQRNVLLPEALAAYIGAEVARAVHVAHTATEPDGRPFPIVHRDISPDNILVARSGAIYLSDFGVASKAGTQATLGDEVEGKRGYRAPEQTDGLPVGPAADQFALGRVIAEAADVRCGPLLAALLAKATAPAPQDRFSSAAALAEALAEAVPPPLNPRATLAAWMQLASAELPAEPVPARKDSDHVSPPAGVFERVSAPLFAAVSGATGRTRLGLRWLAAVCAACALGVPLAALWADAHGRSRLRPWRPVSPSGELRVPEGELRVRSLPLGAEVYVDGTLRGTTPLGLTLPVGRHTLRIGDPRLERWKGSDIVVRTDRTLAAEVDLTR